MRIAAGRAVVPIAIVALTAAALLAAAKSDGYTPFVLAAIQGVLKATGTGPTMDFL